MAISRLSNFLKGAFRTVFCVLIATCVLVGGAYPSAIAAPTDSTDIALSRAANELDRVAGEGTSDMIQGKAQKDLGTVKRNVGEVTGQVEGAAEQVKGRAQQDLGRTKGAIEDAGDDVEEATDSFVDSVKDLFGQ
ncbi:MAG: CsbD family protein [Cyanobacteria bacterium P01_A01_bin.114]